MKEKIRICSEILEKTNPKDIVILSHADHDGLTGSCLIDLIYSNTKPLLKKFHPSRTQSYFSILNKVFLLSPKYLLIIDALIRSYQKFIEKFLKKGIKVINLDHHDLLSIKHENYLDINPHNWNFEFMNSSGLCWLIAKEIDEKYFKERCWIAGIGAIQDYCIEDNKELMEELVRREYIKKISLESALDSELLKHAKTIDSAVNLFSVNETYQIFFQAARENDIKKLQTNEKFVKAFEIYKNKLNEVYRQIDESKKINEIGGIKVKFYDLKGNDISMISDFCEMEREKAIYVGYSNGLLGFRSLFYDYDVRKLAKVFGGGGPHRRVGGAKTSKLFNEIVKEVSNYLRREKSQRMLDEFG